MKQSKYLNVAFHLSKMAQKMPNSPAVIVQNSSFTGAISYSEHSFKELEEQSNIIASGLKKYGINKGTRTVLMVKPSFEFISLTFALFKVGAIPVMIDPGIGLKNLKICLTQVKPTAFIGIPKAQVARLLFGWAKNTIKITISVGTNLLWGGLTLKDIIKAGSKIKNFETAQVQSSDTIAILFTSGNTGISKGVVYTHGIFNAQIKSLRSLYGIKPGDLDLATFPLFALWGPAMGMTAVIPDMDASRPVKADPKKLIKAIQEYNITQLFASPALINKIGRYGVDNNINLPSLTRVLSAGAPANPKSLERFMKLLSQGIQIYTPYGATEALPICNIGSDQILKNTRKLTDKGKGNCVGKPVTGVNLKIIKITDAPIKHWSSDLELPTGVIGEIVVKGPTVTKEYYNLIEQTRGAKIFDKKTRGFYHRMGDVGYFDGKGQVWYCGRKAHRVEIEDGTLFSLPCEAIFNVHPKVYRTALVGVTIGGVVQPVICLELEKSTSENN